MAIIVMSEAVVAVLKMLNPITPHIAQTLWAKLGYSGSIKFTDWPVADKDAMIEDEKQSLFKST